MTAETLVFFSVKEYAVSGHIYRVFVRGKVLRDLHA
jgi:hypothetical protein